MPAEGVPVIDVDVRTRSGPVPLPPSPWVFPDCSKAPAEGPAASGGDYRPATIVAAYRAGAFPWPHEEDDRLWFSPDPRAVLPPLGFHMTRRLARTIRAGRFRVSLDGAFDRVIDLCSTVHSGTWITPRLKAGYCELHRLGWAHSFEVWTADDELAGGLYGLGVGALYGAESMFHLVTDASKVAVAAMVQHVRGIGVQLIDLQVLNPHTASLGGIEIPRATYLDTLRRIVDQPVDWTRPRNQPAAG